MCLLFVLQFGIRKLKINFLMPESEASLANRVPSFLIGPTLRVASLLIELSELLSLVNNLDDIVGVAVDVDGLAL